MALLLAAWRLGVNTLVPSPSLGAAALATLTAQSHGPLTATAVPGGGVTLAREETDPAAADGFSVPDPAESLLTLTTSGSTGVPKLVPIGIGAFDRFADWATGKFGIDGATRSLSFSPLNFDLALLDVWTVLEAGGTVVLADAGASGDAGYLRELALDNEVTLVQGVPLLHRLLAVDEARYPAVRTVVFTGEAVSNRGCGTRSPPARAPASTTSSAVPRPTTASSRTSTRRVRPSTAHRHPDRGHRRGPADRRSRRSRSPPGSRHR